MLDLSRILAGPWCSQQLADVGADVVKVELPELGDDTRHWGPPFVDLDGEKTAAYFLAANRGKQSICLDFKKVEDYKTLLSLVAEADVVIQNYLPHTATKLAIDFDSLRAVNSKLIYCEISGYGSKGSFSERPGYDALIQAEAGLMHLTGEENPVKVGVAITDLFTGMYAAQAITAALYQNQTVAKARKIEISLFDCQLQMLANQAMNFLVTKQEPQRLGSAHPNIVPYQVFQTADKPFMLAVGNERQFQYLCKALDISELASDTRCTTNAERVKNRVWLTAFLQTKFVEYDRTRLLNILEQNFVPAAALQNFTELFNSRIVEERALIREVRSGMTSHEMIAGPVIIDDESCFNSKPPPKLDQNRQQIIERWLLKKDQS